MAGRTITVRFDSNVAPGLPWTFEPERRTIDVHLGEVVTVYYTVTNESARVTTGQAGYNVTPPTVGIYFEKINCFCFTQQTMKPGEKRDMAVVFYVDPKLAKDSEQDTLNNITLSYTFYPVRDPVRRWRRARVRKSPGISDTDRQTARTVKPGRQGGEDDDGRRTRRTAPRLPPGQSQPVAGGRRDLGIRRGRRRHLVDASHGDLCAVDPGRWTSSASPTP